ncbi:MAG: histidine phosphatase family protein [Actinobacteria bacterium]|nr:histidine phosphatase family protein [Actinomycetota bacterium]
MAVKELVLLRHAKSDWAAAFTDDADRPLNARGREAAGVMGRVLSRAGKAPDLVLTSPARRSRETVELAGAAGAWAAPVVVDSRLSPGSPGAVIAAVRDRAGDAGRVLVVGHEPAWSQTVAALTGGGRVKMATAAAACLEVASWADLEPGRAVLLWMLVPRLFTDGAVPPA